MKTTTYLWLTIFIFLCILLYPNLDKASSPSQSDVLEAYLRVFPDVKGIGIIYSDAQKEKAIHKLEKIATAKKIKVIKARVPSVKEFPQALRDMKGRVDTFWVLDDPLFSLKEAWYYFVLFSLRNHIKTVVFTEKALASGGLFYYTDKKEVMINKKILEVLGLKVSEKAGPVRYFMKSSQEGD